MKPGEQKAVPRGTVVADRYRVERRLAKGGMATVYEATDTTLSRKVALKVLRPPKSDDPGRLTERFRLEAEALARLNHRHIVAIYDYGDLDDGGHYLVMELVEGPSLYKAIKRERLGVERAMRIGYQVARALRYAHKADIIHRDVKPGNVLLATEDEEEIAKLVDFGLVKLQDGEALTAHGLILGTVHCMAPEQIRGGDLDGRTDIYALGVMLFRMLTGEYPFQSEQSAEVLAAHLHAAVPSFASIDPHLRIPPDLEDVVRRCLQKNQANRYQTTSELIRDLEQCMRTPVEQYTNVTEATIPEKAARRWGSRGLLVALVLALFVLALLLGLITAVLVVDRFSEPGGLEPKEEAGLDIVLPVEPAEPDEPAVDEPEPPAMPEPAPRPRPRAPAVEPEAEDAAPEPPEPDAEAPSASAPRYPTRLVGLDVAKEPDEVRIKLRVAGRPVRPLHFASENSAGAFAKLYQVMFKSTGSELEVDSQVVGHPLVESVVTGEQDGSLVVQVNSKGTPRMRLEGSGPEYVVVVTP